MIIKSYEIRKNKSNLQKNNFFLLYGENLGLKKDIKSLIISDIKEKNSEIEKSNTTDPGIFRTDFGSKK